MKAIILILISLALCSCGAPAASERTVEVTRLVEVTVPVEVTRQIETTRLVEVTVPVEVTRQIIATVTPPPTVTPGPSPARVALAEPVTLDIGGVRLTVKSLVLIDWADALREPALAALAEFDAFQDAQVFGALSVKLENTTSGKINIYADQGSVVIGSEQIDLGKFMFYSEGDVGGTFFEGVVSEGVILFALRATPWAAVAAGTAAIYEVGAPSDDNYKRLGDAPYRFELTLAPLTP